MYMVYIIHSLLCRLPEGCPSVLPFCFRVILQFPSGTVLRATLVPHSYFRRAPVALANTAGPPDHSVVRAGGLCGLHLSQVPAARVTGSALFAQSAGAQIGRGKGWHEHLVIIVLLLVLLGNKACLVWWSIQMFLTAPRPGSTLRMAELLGWLLLRAGDGPADLCWGEPSLLGTFWMSCAVSLVFRTLRDLEEGSHQN